MGTPSSLGEGRVSPAELGAAGAGCVIEPGARIFGPEWIRFGRMVYVGHEAFLRAYPQGALVVGDGCWIGPGCFLNSFGSLVIGRRVGLGPGVKIITSQHRRAPAGGAVLDQPLVAAPVVIEDGVDLGAGAIVLPGVTIGAGAIVGAGAVVRRSLPAGCVAVGVPARVLPAMRRGP